MLTPIRLADLSLDISDEELRTIEDTAASGQNLKIEAHPDLAFGA
jgi:hypothetical protein